jgi:superoxide dismutase, Cu-Zn family
MKSIYTTPYEDAIDECVKRHFGVKEILMKKVTNLALTLCTAAFMQAHGASAEPQATAKIMDTEGNRVGNAALTTTDKGVKVQVNVEGLEVAGGSLHGIHLHQVGKCKPPFESAGDHFNPLGHKHGYLRPNGPHAGDLPGIWIEANGNARYAYTTDLVTLKKGKRALLDANGAAIVIHAEPDNYLTGTSGSAGDPIACGVITASSG